MSDDPHPSKKIRTTTFSSSPFQVSDMFFVLYSNYSILVKYITLPTSSSTKIATK